MTLARYTLFIASILMMPSIAEETTSKEEKEYIDGVRLNAEKGDSNSQAKLGYYYHVGKSGVSLDLQKAKYWYELAEKQNHPMALYALGGMFEFGHGVEVDFKKSAEYYLRVGEQGAPAAQRKLGILHHLGQGLPKDNVRAYFWLMIGGIDNDKFTRDAFDGAKSEMTVDEISEAERLVQQFEQESNKSLQSTETSSVD